MKVLLVDADSMYSTTMDGKKILRANLALMKISSYLRDQGHEPSLAYYDTKGNFINPLEDPDDIWMSAVFTRSIDRVMELKEVYPDSRIGGSGYDFRITLPDEIEHIMPDYDLYGIDHSVGYTTRGCFRDCKFCIVPEKEGKIHHNATIDEFLRPGHDKVKLLDNNFFAGPRWRDHIEFIREHDLQVSFNQGIDVRIMTEEMAQAIASVKYRSGSFGGHYIHIAFDSTSYEDQFRKGVEILLDHIKPYTVIVYILVGFDSTIEDNQHRLDVVVDYGMYPFVMQHEHRSIVDHFFARYVNKRLYKKRSFDEYTSYRNWKIKIKGRYSEKDLLLRWK